jgi:outer membrane biosynthesis protein TonB
VTSFQAKKEEKKAEPGNMKRKTALVLKDNDEVQKKMPAKKDPPKKVQKKMPAKKDPPKKVQKQIPAKKDPPKKVAPVRKVVENDGEAQKKMPAKKGPVLQPSHPTKSHSTNSTSTTLADNKSTLIFLRSVLAVQEPVPRHPLWVVDNWIAEAFYSRQEAGVSNNYRSAKKNAIQQCYVEIRRQDPVSTSATSPDFQAGRSTRSYFRLTALGRLTVAGK